jgi:hypothetical protein
MDKKSKAFHLGWNRIPPNEEKSMTPKLQWLSLAGGIVLFLIGIRSLYQERDAVILIISILIVGFTLAKMYKTRQDK